MTGAQVLAIMRSLKTFEYQAMDDYGCVFVFHPESAGIFGPRTLDVPLADLASEEDT